MKQCIICKKIFIPTARHQKCCSKECSRTNNDIWHKSEKGILSRKKYKNTEKFKSTLKKYVQTKKYKEYQKKYWHTDKYKKYKNKYNKIGKGKEYRESKEYKELNKKYRKSYLGKSTISYLNKRRREWLNNTITGYNKEQWKQKCEACDGICPKCNKPFDHGSYKLTLDHILSLYWANIYFKQTGKKWVYTIDEIQPLCAKCNLIKHNKLLDQFKFLFKSTKKEVNKCTMMNIIK